MGVKVITIYTTKLPREHFLRVYVYNHSVYCSQFLIKAFACVLGSPRMDYISRRVYRCRNLAQTPQYPIFGATCIWYLLMSSTVTTLVSSPSSFASIVASLQICQRLHYLALQYVMGSTPLLNISPLILMKTCFQSFLMTVDDGLVPCSY